MSDLAEYLTVGQIASLMQTKRWRVHSIKGLFGDPIIVGTTYLYSRKRVLAVLNRAADIAATSPNDAPAT